MALMEYCLVNIVLGDSDAPKPPPDPNKQDKDKIFDLAAKVGPVGLGRKAQDVGPPAP